MQRPVIVIVKATILMRENRKDQNIISRVPKIKLDLFCLRMLLHEMRDDNFEVDEGKYDNDNEDWLIKKQIQLYTTSSESEVFQSINLSLIGLSSRHFGISPKTKQSKTDAKFTAVKILRMCEIVSSEHARTSTALHCCCWGGKIEESRPRAEAEEEDHSGMPKEGRS
jgi:hypothetical protein